MSRYKIKNKNLKRVVKLAHKTTFKIFEFFEKIYDYSDRLEKMDSEWIKKVKSLRDYFYFMYRKDKNFRDEFFEYMLKTKDYLLFCNLLVSAPDQRKFDNKGEYIPFTIYPHQMVIWEVSRKYSISMPKSRDMGASFLFNSGYAMNMLLSEAFEVLFLSRIEDDVDRKGDFHQTNMGRVRQIIKSTKIFNYDNFDKDVKLFLQKDEKVLIKGSSSNPEAGRQGRYQEIWLDEAGANPKLKDIKQALSFAGKRVHYTGTLKPGTDQAFRQVILDAEELKWREIYDDFLENYGELDDYRSAWGKTIENIKIDDSRVVRFHVKYYDHPLKAGDTNYYEIECNRLYNDPVIIAHELNADLYAGSPDRSLYNANNDHFADLSGMNLEMMMSMRLYGGFDPGGHKTASIVPVLTDIYGFNYVLPEERFDKGSSMKAWMYEVMQKYPIRLKRKQILYTDRAIKTYEKVGGLWNAFIHAGEYARNFQIIPVSNRDMEDKLLVVNAALNLRQYNPFFGEETPKIIFDEKNREWVMGVIYGEKYGTDKKQKDLSHPFDAFVYFAFNFWVDKLEYEDRRILMR